MHAIAEAFTEIVRLIGDTFRLWWNNLVAMLSWFFAGYVAFRLSTQGAIWLGVHQHDKISIGLFSFGVLAQIAAVVGMIRACAASLYRWRDAAAGPGETTDPTRQRLIELLTVTMLPLIAVWSAWGFLDDRIDQYAGDYLISQGIGDVPFDVTDGHWKSYLLPIVVLLAVRRVLEWVDEKWPSRAGTLLQIWVEAFFALLVVVVTPVAVREAKGWIADRRFWHVTVDVWGSAKEWFTGIKIPVPDGLEWLWGEFAETLWPLFKAGVAEPLTWLAITAVVFGHRALAGAGVFRGTRIESRLGARAEAPSQSRLVAITSKAPNLVLGGLREKFYPTLSAFRLLVGSGPVFLGVVCFVYTLHYLGAEWFDTGVNQWIGNRDFLTPMWEGVVWFAKDAIFEPLRIALLAAAFDQCISVSVGKRVEAAEAQRAAEPEAVAATA